MITLTNLQKNIYDIFVPVLGTLIWAYPNADRPSQPYIDMNISPVSKIGGNDYMNSPNSAGLSTFTGNREIVLNFRSFGVGGIDKLNSLFDVVEKPSFHQSMLAKEIVYVRFMTGVLDITEIVNTTYEERGVVDMLLRISSQYTDDVGLIEHVYGEYDIINYDDTVISDLITITT